MIGFAMTDYLLAFGTNKAPAARAPDHMAAWLDSRGYKLVRSPAGPADPDDSAQVARIAAEVDWYSVAYDPGARHAIVRQVLAAAGAAAPAEFGAPWVA